MPAKSKAASATPESSSTSDPEPQARNHKPVEPPEIYGGIEFVLLGEYGNRNTGNWTQVHAANLPGGGCLYRQRVRNLRAKIYTDSLEALSWCKVKGGKLVPEDLPDA